MISRILPAAVTHAAFALTVSAALYLVQANINCPTHLNDIERVRRSVFTGSSSLDLDIASQFRMHLIFQYLPGEYQTDSRLLDIRRDSIVDRRIVSSGVFDIFYPDLQLRNPNATTLSITRPMWAMVLLYVFARVGTSMTIRAVQGSIVPISWPDVPCNVRASHARTVRRVYYATALLLVIPFTLLLQRSFEGLRLAHSFLSSTDPSLPEIVSFTIGLTAAASAVTRLLIWHHTNLRWMPRGNSSLRTCITCGYHIGHSRGTACPECNTTIAGRHARVSTGVIVPMLLLSLSIITPALVALGVGILSSGGFSISSAAHSAEMIALRPIVNPISYTVTLNYRQTIEIETSDYRCVIVTQPCQQVPVSLELKDTMTPHMAMYSHAHWALMRQPTSSDPADPCQWSVYVYGPEKHNSGDLPLSFDLEVIHDSTTTDPHNALLYLTASTATNFRPIRVAYLPSTKIVTMVRHSENGIWSEVLVADVRKRLIQNCNAE